MVSSGIEVRRYRPDDEQHIADLFRLTFRRDFSLQRWRWWVRDNPAGQGVIGQVWQNGELVAALVNSPVRLRVEGEERLTALVGTVMTHPEQQRLGLLRDLAEATWSWLGEQGFAMVWGFPNAVSHRLFVEHLIAVDIHEVPTFRLALSKVSQLPDPSPHVVELPNVDARFDRLWERVSNDRRVIARRDQQHVSWRYVGHPAVSYRILACLDDEQVRGYAVLKPYRGELHVVDLLALPDVQVGVDLLLKAAHLAVESSLGSLSMWLNVNHPLHGALERLGFLNGEPVTYFVARVLRPELAGATVLHYGNWYLTMGDSDVY